MGSSLSQNLENNDTNSQSSQINSDETKKQSNKQPQHDVIYDYDELLAFGYIRIYYENSYNKQYPSSLKTLVYKILVQFAMIILYNCNERSIHKNNTFSKNIILAPISAGIIHQISYHSELLDIHCNGDAKIVDYPNIITLNDEEYFLGTYDHFRIIVHGHLHITMNCIIGTYLNKGGTIDIQCEYLHMTEGSYIVACGQQFGGKININIRKQLILEVGECYILCNSLNSNKSGQIQINIGECIQSEGDATSLVVDIAGNYVMGTGNGIDYVLNHDPRNGRFRECKPKCKGGVIDVNCIGNASKNGYYKVKLCGSNDGILRWNKTLYHVNKLTVKNDIVYWRLRR